MEKVMVNKVVAGWIERHKKEIAENYVKGDALKKATLEKILKTTPNDVLVHNNIDIVTLAKAIQYGYVVPYEFKEDDVIRQINSSIPLLVINDVDIESVSTRNLSYVNENKNIFVLVCKAENREDLK